MALITDMGVLPNAGGIIHPIVKHKWRVFFYGIGGPRGNVQTSGTDGEILTLQAVQGDRPKLEFEEIELHRYNSRAWVAGKHNWQTASYQFEADVGGRVTQIFQEQLEKQQAIIAPGAGRVLNSAYAGQQYKFAMISQMMDGDITPLESWALEGCFIQAIDYGEKDYSVSEAMKISVTFRYDHARQLITGIEGMATGGPAPLGNSNS